MKKVTLVIIILCTLAFIALGGYVLLKYQRKQPKQFAWYPFYETRGILKKEPYSLYLLKKLMEERSGIGELKGIKEPLQDFFADKKEKNGVYLFVGHSPIYSEEGVEALMDYAAAGNDLFLAVSGIPEPLAASLGLDSLCREGTFNVIYDDKAVTTIPGEAPAKKWTFPYRLGNDTAVFQYGFLNPAYCKTGTYPFTAKGFLLYHKEQDNPDQMFSAYYATPIPDDEMCIMGEWKIGAGTLTIHTNPLFFSNYYLITPEGYEYASTVFRFIGKEKDIYFDQYSKSDHQSAASNTPEGLNDSLLGFVLSSRGLREAWYLLILMAALFVLFRSRRIQRPVPVAEPNTDDTMEFVKTLGRLYMNGNDHLSLALKQRSLFYRHLNRRYGIRANVNMDEAAAILVAKTGLTFPFLNRLLGDLKVLEMKENFTAADLLQFHDRLHYFYTQTR